MKAWIEAPVPDQLNPVLALQILGNGTLLTKSPGRLTRESFPSNGQTLPNLVREGLPTMRELLSGDLNCNAGLERSLFSNNPRALSQ